TLEFFYDFMSSYSYLASRRVEAMAKRAGAEVRFRPFFLAGVFKATGNVAPIEVPAKLAYLMKDLDRWAKRERIPFFFPAQFPQNTLLALRGAFVAEEKGKLV